MNGIMAKQAVDKPTPGDTPDPNANPADQSVDQAAPTDSTGNSDTQQGEAATPAEQDAYTKTVLAGLKVLADDKSHQQVMQTLQQGDRPDSAMANVVVSIMTELDRQSQGKIPEAVIIPAAMEILAELGDLAQTAGVFEVDDATMTGAAQQVVMKLLEQYGVNSQDVQAVISKIDPAKVKQMVADQQKSASGWAGDQPTQDQPDQSQPLQGQTPQQPGLMQQQPGSVA